MTIAGAYLLTNQVADRRHFAVNPGIVLPNLKKRLKIPNSKFRNQRMRIKRNENLAIAPLSTTFCIVLRTMSFCMTQGSKTDNSFAGLQRRHLPVPKN